ncbi:MAG: SDR family oxidoreductase [Treponema sp.]|jgi:NAD(P)-dependent dehydrogenase (short-subunit alcohol dehydrogenase family)|nr:SDR family oxidoreductase [Treponema sp.]
MRVFDLLSLQGKTAVITGAAGLYGRCAAAALYEAGARVFTGSTNLENLEKAAEEMRAEGGDVTAFHLDLGNEASILEFHDKVMAQAGTVDILVNNSVARPMSDGYDGEVSHFEESMRINATGNFIITRAFGRDMIRQKLGSIINVASMHGMIGPDPTLYEGLGMEGWGGDYYFHKGGMIAFTRFLASYYGRFGIRCNAISPGGIRSYRTPEEFVRRYSQRTMLGRMAGPDDIKGAIVYFASDASRYVTAANLPLDGGYTAK